MPKALFLVGGVNKLNNIRNIDLFICISVITEAIPLSDFLLNKISKTLSRNGKVFLSIASKHDHMSFKKKIIILFYKFYPAFIKSYLSLRWKNFSMTKKNFIALFKKNNFKILDIDFIKFSSNLWNGKGHYFVVL